MPRKSYDVARLKSAARGVWSCIFQDLSGLPDSILDGQHHPCPKCGGTDRFRMIDSDAGALHCNQCFTSSNGDGIAALMWLHDLSFPDALEKLGMFLGQLQDESNAINQGEGFAKLPTVSTAAAATASADAGSVTAPTTPVDKDPARSLSFLSWFEPKAAVWCRTKPGVTVDALQLAGARLAQHLSKYSVIALPAFCEAPTTGSPCGWVLMERSGGTLPVFHPDKAPTQEKVKVSSGSRAGMCNAHALSILCDPVKRAAVCVLWKCEGVSDMLAVQSLIPSDLRDTHLVVTNSDGCGGKPKRWFLDLVSQCAALQKIYVVHDADRPGQNGAVGYRDQKQKLHPGWCQHFASFAPTVCEVRNVVLPFPVVESNGNDVRDWICGSGITLGGTSGIISQGEGAGVSRRTYAELLSLAESMPVIVRPAVIRPPATAATPAVDDAFTDGVPDGLVCNGVPNPEADKSSDEGSGSDGAPSIIPLPMAAIIRRVQYVTSNWPRRVAGRLFVHDENTDNAVHWLEKPDALFGYLGSVGQFGPPRFYTTAGFHTKAELYSELCRLAPEYKSIETVPHEPPIAGHYYACETIEPTPAADADDFAVAAASHSTPPDRSHLDQLLDRFNPSTDIDRDLILSMFATSIWGGHGGSRPMFVITSKQGRGAGKSTLAECVGQLVGGLMSFSSGEDAEEMKKRLLSPEGRSKRVALIDNLKTHRFSWAELEALVTAREISGRQMFVGEGSKPNTLTWCVTMNGLAVSTDVSQRAIIIFVDRPKHSGEWAEETSRFIDDHRREIIADLIAFLRRPQFDLRKSTRWGTWERAVLSRLPEPSEAQRVILERQRAADVEDEESGIVADYIRSKCETLGYDIDDRVFLPSSLMAQWYSEATRERYTVTAASRILRQKIEEGNMPQLILNTLSKAWGRGFIWRTTGFTEIDQTTNRDTDNPVKTDVECRIDQEKRDQKSLF